MYGDYVEWTVVGFAIAAIPYSWCVVRVASIAYFQAKMDYHDVMFRKLEKENLSD